MRLPGLSGGRLVEGEAEPGATIRAEQFGKHGPQPRWLPVGGVIGTGDVFDDFGGAFVGRIEMESRASAIRERHLHQRSAVPVGIRSRRAYLPDTRAFGD